MSLRQKNVRILNVMNAMTLVSLLEKREDKVRKTKISLSYDKVCCCFNDETRILKKHIFLKGEQPACANFGQDTFSIFTACGYLRVNGKFINENFTIVSEASDHSRIVAFSCINKVFGFIGEKHNLTLPIILHIWSDECLFVGLAMNAKLNGLNVIFVNNSSSMTILINKLLDLIYYLSPYRP